MGRVVVPVLHATAGRLTIAADATIVIVDGALLREVRLGNRRSAELLGRGDVLRLRDDSHWVWGSRLQVLSSVRLAVVSRTHDRASLVDLLALRDVHAQAARMLGRLVLQQEPQLDGRIETLLPDLAERWGVVTPEGIVLPSFLGHWVFAALLGVRRPSFTAAAQRFAQDGRLIRLNDRRWRVDPALALDGATPALAS